MKYIYRGICIVEYDADKKEINYPMDMDIPEAHINNVRLLPEDHMLLAQFHLDIVSHQIGNDVDLIDVVVN